MDRVKDGSEIGTSSPFRWDDKWKFIRSTVFHHKHGTIMLNRCSRPGGILRTTNVFGSLLASSLLGQDETSSKRTYTHLQREKIHPPKSFQWWIEVQETNSFGVNFFYFLLKLFKIFPFYKVFDESQKGSRRVGIVWIYFLICRWSQFDRTRKMLAMI